MATVASQRAPTTRQKGQNQNSTSLPSVNSKNDSATAKHKKYHKCNCYGHHQGLPDYALLAMPRTNNYYAAVGGCPCIPRAAAHPGSWRCKESTMRSATYRCGSGCINKNPPQNGSGCCLHTGHEYGWKAGPHTVHPKHTAATGKCDTFGNMAFKSTAGRGYVDDNVSELSSVSPQKLEDLEALILEEHEARLRAEQDLAELQEIQASGTQDQYKTPKKPQVDVSEEDLNELMREVKSIVDRPLNQTNIELLRRVLQRQEQQQRLREYNASKLNKNQ